MLAKFSGDEGKRRLKDVLMKHALVRSNETLVSELMDNGELKELAEGDNLIEQGARDNDIFLIIAGAVDIFVNGRHVASRKTGDYVGEMAVIDHSAPRSATVTTTEKSLFLCVSEEDFSRIAHNHVYLWRDLAAELAIRLRQRGLKIKSPNVVVQVFIGCTSEQLTIANHLQVNFCHDPFSAIVWTNGIFGPSKTPIESLELQLEDSDFAVFVLGNDDTLISRDCEYSVPRDNIVFELGLFIAKLGRNRVFIVKERSAILKIPSDLLGVGVIEYILKGKNLDADLGPVCTKIRDEVNKIGPF
jgi:CRP/FNR family cyclic AMP-dependent transcriptional regulator